MHASRSLFTLLLIAQFAFITPSLFSQAPAASGSLEFSFAFGPGTDMQPSYQTAIWLQDEQGKYVKPLFVSEYLAYGGFNDPTICPEWTQVAKWDQATEAEYDAVSRPTPPIGENTIKIDCKKLGLAPGKYQYLLQVHLVEKFNILYKGAIEIGDKPGESVPDAQYSPEKHPGGAAVISGVKVQYVPGQ